MKKLKHIINSIVWTLAGAYLLLIVLVQLPPIQGFLGSQVSDALAKKLGTKVEVGSVNLGFLNRIIIDDVMMYDQRGDSMLYASRLSVKIDYMPLLKGRVSIASAQLFGLKANLYKETSNSKPNFQFVIDSLASKDKNKPHTPLDLHIGSLIIRHGFVKYDQRDIADKRNVFSPQHIEISGLSSHFIIDKITDNNIKLSVKRLSFTDKSRLQVKSLDFKLTANKQEAMLKDFNLKLPNSELSLGDIHASYHFENGKFNAESLQFEGSIEQSKITLSDISCFLPIFRHFDDALYFSSHFTGTSTSIRCKDINFRTGSGSINLQAKGRVSDWNTQTAWAANIDNLTLTEQSIDFLTHNFASKTKIPKEVLRLGNIHYEGTLHGKGKDVESKGKLETGAGNALLVFSKSGDNFKAKLETPGIALDQILANNTFGQLAASLEAMGTKDNIYAKGKVSRFDYHDYHYSNISIDGRYSHGLIKGGAEIADPNINLSVKGDYNTKNSQYDLLADVQHLKPSILGINMRDKSYCLNHISLNANNKSKESYIDLEAPFANLHTKGQYDLSTLVSCIKDLVADKLPTLPGIRKGKVVGDNDFTLQANIYSTEILDKMFGIPVSISSPVHINGNISERAKDLNLLVTLPVFSYNGSPFHDGNIELTTTDDDALTLDARISQGMPYEKAPTYHLQASAAHNVLSTLINYDNQSQKLPIKGLLNANTEFSAHANGTTYIKTDIQPSHVKVGDTQWDVLPSTVSYFKNNLQVSNFTVKHDDQHIIINGKATPDRNDSIIADLKDVDVAYILNLVNFHSVDFTGKATGKAIIKSIFQDPDAYALLDVRDFTFEDGPLGILHAFVNYNKAESQIDIKATADEGSGHQTYIDGYVSPKRNYIDLGIEAAGTNMKFMESFCGSFMDDIQATAKGTLHVVGDLSNINLVGDITATGKMHMKQLGTEYHFKNLRAHAIPDDILLQGDTIYDKNENFALVKGGIHHKHLTKLSYDLDLKAHNFLGYDTHEFGDNTFCGTVYATGNVGIHGKSGETVIDIEAVPEPGSIFVYNVAGPESISDKDFIHWQDATPEWEKPFTSKQAKSQDDDDDLPSDMRINFLINTNPNLTLKLIMDEQSGDYITLNGNGVIRANYFNKGSFDMFGNYVVDHGVYKLTIQNIIKKDFEFTPGGTINFGGNPYKAPLNLQAKYVVNGVPLSDLNIGRSFSSNNIKVNCLMNIKGTPSAPNVDFSLDMPTVNSDVKQMIYSLINSQEEMNQQVFYLLGVGRFYAQSKNNQMSEEATQQSQASLAMQSILSGTLSQQINTVLSNLIKSNNWNFGANISTGDEGFYNAEYEGILSGRLLNNRLLFNGQFGYRDNANTTQSFIGDFDLRYLIFPNGDLSIRMYNQTNDRYFTKNSLNTQGIGLIIKRDFNGLGDLFGFKNKKKKKKNSKK